jgi:hypothetical protein
VDAAAFLLRLGLTIAAALWALALDPVAASAFAGTVAPGL